MKEIKCQLTSQEGRKRSENTFLQKGSVVNRYGKHGEICFDRRSGSTEQDIHENDLKFIENIILLQ